MRRIGMLLFIAGIVSPVMSGQESIPQQYLHGFLLEKQGQYDAAVRTLEPLIDSAVLNRGDRGRVWTLLGYSYEEIGLYQKAQDAYEHALRALEGDTQYLGAYANALDYFAGYYRSTGRAPEAVRMWTRALAIYEQQNSRRGVALIYANLAGLALEQKHMRSAKSFLGKALAKAKEADDLTDDDLAILSEVQGWIASAHGDNQSAIAEYQHTLDLRKHSHGDNFPLTGWTYLILGRAYAANGQMNDALTNIREGLAILEQTGRQTPRYLAGEMIYSQVLYQSGSHAEASRLKASAQQSLGELFRRQCIGCSVSVLSYR